MDYPVTQNESERIEALHRLRILDTEPTAEFDAVVDMAAAIFEAPIALISFVDRDHQWFKAKLGLEEDRTCRDVAFCNYTILENYPFEVEDAAQDERFRNNPLVTDKPHIRYYVAVPISLDGKTNIATLCVIDTKPRRATKTLLSQLEKLRNVAVGLIRSHTIAIEARTSERNARQLGKLLSQVERISKIGAWSLDTERLTSEWSPETFVIHEIDGSETPGFDEALSFYPEYERRRVIQEINKCIMDGTPYEIECDLVTATGNKKRVRTVGEVERGDDGTKFLIGIVKDITDEYEQGIQLWRAAHIDHLTGIANRFSFQSEIELRINAETTDRTELALLMIDLDNFKDINDNLGHLAGDKVLLEVAQRIAQSSSEYASCARLGGDEFAVLLTVGPDIKSPEDLALILLEEINTPIMYEQHEIRVGASIGVAKYEPADIATADDLFRRSDLALYHVKENGRGKIQIYDAALMNAFEEKRCSVMTVKSAIKDARLVPHYQPIVDLKTNQIRNVEALARIRNHDGTISGPGDFWHALFEPQCSRQIDEVIFDLALKDFAHWKRCGLDIDFISVNASSSRIQSVGFVAQVLNGLHENGLSPRDLKIEVVESVLLGHDSTDVGEVLEQLSAKGVRIALDDFGTGYASLSHLRDYPINCIKIDKSFVLGLGRNGSNTAIVKALIGLRESMGLEIIAEGIETQDQLDFVSSLGCNFGQGYLFSRPVEARNLELLLTRNRDIRPKSVHVSIAAA